MTSITSSNLGSVQVWFGHVTTQRTLFIRDDLGYGVSLYEWDGVRVTPKSPKLGYHGRRGDDQAGYAQIVCDDDVSADKRTELTSAGYLNVTERG